MRELASPATPATNTIADYECHQASREHFPAQLRMRPQRCNLHGPHAGQLSQRHPRGTHCLPL